MNQLLTTGDLSKKLGVSKGWIYQRTQLTTKDPIPCIRIGLRLLRFREDDVLKWLEEKNDKRKN